MCKEILVLVSGKWVVITEYQVYSRHAGVLKSASSSVSRRISFGCVPNKKKQGNETQ